MKHGRKNAELKNLTFIIYNITEYKSIRWIYGKDFDRCTIRFSFNLDLW